MWRFQGTVGMEDMEDMRLKFEMQAPGYLSAELHSHNFQFPLFFINQSTLKELRQPEQATM
jgi:hypothetical protein